MVKASSHTLDTTILYEQWNLNAAEFLEKINKEVPGKRYTLYYCLYEFKMGLIRNWIEYFQAVERLRDKSKAIIMAMELRGRGGNKTGILLASIERLDESTYNRGDIDEYLCELEVLIREANTGFNYICGQIIGDFSKHPIFKASESLTREDYPKFLEICENNKYVDVADFLELKMSDLESLLSYLKNKISGLRLKKDWGTLQEVVNLIEPLTAKPSRYNNQRRHFGDVIITLDTPRGHTLYSKDKLHQSLADGVGKRYKRFVRDDDKD